MINWRDGTIFFKKHKTARKGKKRTVYCPPALLDLLKRLAETYPTGLLFRNTNGSKWERQTTFKRLRVLEKDTQVKGVTLYSYRHTYVTNAIERGVPLLMLAELVGNSVAILIKNYSHIDQKKDALTAAAVRAIS
jgi:integrase